jgi:hypothetical protein
VESNKRNDLVDKPDDPNLINKQDDLDPVDDDLVNEQDDPDPADRTNNLDLADELVFKMC